MQKATSPKTGRNFLNFIPYVPFDNARGKGEPRLTTHQGTVRVLESNFKLGCLSGRET
jgi:hypothetical protein